eukprot:TCALIF_13548-PA protein Name:"Protein of unknown function" AED:0.16 eAED:0.24 QI:0/0/0/0.5/1/1/2/0/300
MESLAKEADLANMSINQIQAFRLVSLVYADEKLKKKLLELENPSFKTVKQKILAYEKAIFAATTPLTSMAEVNKVTSQSQQKGNNKPKSGKARSWAELDGRCTCCGAKEHKAAQCPRKSSVCNKCGRQGHLSLVCMSGVPYPKRGKAPSPSARASQVTKSTLFDEHSGEPETVGQNPFKYEESDFVSYVRAMEALQSASGSCATPRINVHIRSHQNVQFHIRAIPDTGATRTMLSLDLVQRHGLDMESTHDTVRAANGDQMKMSSDKDRVVNAEMGIVIPTPKTGKDSMGDYLEYFEGLE